MSVEEGNKRCFGASWLLIGVDLYGLLVRIYKGIDGLDHVPFNKYIES